MKKANDSHATVSKELPKYKLHEIIGALKIKKIEWLIIPYDYQIRPPDQFNEIAGIIHWEEEGYDPIEVTLGWVLKYQPQVGGYYIIREDAKTLYDEADNFKTLYLRLSEQDEVAQAYKTLTNAIKIDPEFRRSYHANIAVAFKEEVKRMMEEKNISPQSLVAKQVISKSFGGENSSLLNLDELSRAANNFLDQW